MKAVMVFDVEDVCKNCMSRIILHCKGWENRHEECPWKPLPQKKEVDYSKVMGYADGFYSEGWNACLDEITGETE